VAERIVKSIAEKTFLNSGIATNITISGGMAGFPRHAEHVQDLIIKADKAMYETKSVGGNGVTITADA
jgi:diguanylate cyclase (GGDEF)-like protein